MGIGVGGWEMININYWVCVYSIEGPGGNIFLYGYATPARGTSKTWKIKRINLPKAKRLNRFSIFMTEAELLEFRNRFLCSHALSLLVEKSPFEVKCGTMIERPAIYALEHESTQKIFPKSLSGDLATISALWSIDKEAIIHDVFPADSREDVIPVLAEILRALEKETSINFTASEIARFGNFEIIDYPYGDYSLPSGLSIFTENKIHPINQESHTDSILVRIDSPLAQDKELIIGCKLYNGYNSTIILDQVKKWNPKDREEPIRFQAKEPLSKYDVSVWDSENGSLVAHKSVGLVRSIPITMGLAGPRQHILSKWTKSLPSNLRERAEKVDRITYQHIHIKPDSFDPWRDAEEHAEHLKKILFPKGTKDKFFENSSESQLGIAHFLNELISDPEVKKAVIIDPFFGVSGLDMLIARLHNPHKSIVVITSCVKDVDPEQSSSVKEYDSAAALREFCEHHKDLLPNSLEIISLENPSRSDQQFHDRYLLLEMEHEQVVYILSNSLNSAARRFPLTIARLSDSIAPDLVSYLSELKQGNIKGRPQLQKNVVWKTPVRHQPRYQVAAMPNGLEMFKGWETVLDLIIDPSVLQLSDRILLKIYRIFGSTSQITDILLRNATVLDNKDGKMSWRLPEDQVKDIVSLIKNRINHEPNKAPQILTALAFWAYHGGPDSLDYEFEASIAASVKTLLSDWVDKLENDTSRKYTFQPLQEDWSAALSLNPIFSQLRYPDGWFEFRFSPEGTFFSSLLFRLSPDLLINLITERKSWPLFALILNEVNNHDSQFARPLLNAASGVLQALGIAILWREYLIGDNPLDAIKTRLSESSISNLDQFLVLIYLTLDLLKGNNFQGLPSELITSIWPKEPMNEKLKQSLKHIIGEHARNQVPAVAEILAEIITNENDAKFLREWGIEEIIRRLPMKGQPQESTEHGFSASSDYKNTHTIARLLWRLYADPLKWYEDEILNKLDFGGFNDPLLRTRDYSFWDSLTTGLLWGLYIGNAIVIAAPEDKKDLASSYIFEKIADKLSKLEPEVWFYQDNHLLLGNLMINLGRSINLEKGSPKPDIILQFANNNFMPGWLRLLLILSSQKLAGDYKAELVPLIQTVKTDRLALFNAKDLISFFLRVRKAHQHDLPKPVLTEIKLLTRSLKEKTMPYNSITYLSKRMSINLDWLKLAPKYGISETDLCDILEVKPQELRMPSVQRKIYPFIRDLMKVFRKLEEFKDDANVTKWMYTPNYYLICPVPNIIPSTPWQLIREGRISDILDLIDKQGIKSK